MRRMRPAERQLAVRGLFTNAEFIGLDDLCQRLQASRSSIRRDLVELEGKGVLRRVHGGAISVQVQDAELDYGRLSISCYQEKARIGKVAAALVEDGQTVILGGGSTTVEVARNLIDRPIQVITNSIPVGQVFWDSKRVEVTLTGGYLYPRLGIQLGPICERMLNSVTADVLIMGVRGITNSGLSDNNTLIVGSIRKMIDIARKVVIVADHTKFGRDSMIHVADLTELDAVVSDTDLDAEYQDLLERNQVICTLA
jgi:DeoR family fructose operon transcriptional repressor